MVNRNETSRKNEWRARWRRASRVKRKNKNKEKRGYEEPKGATSRNVKNKNTFWLVQTCRGCARSGTQVAS